MDPDACLELIYGAMASAVYGADGGSDAETVNADVDAAREASADLVEWLRSGGFEPMTLDHRLMCMDGMGATAQGLATSIRQARRPRP